MQRRIALALSLAFTTIVTFAVVAVGAQAGFFSEHKTAKAAQVAADTAKTGGASTVPDTAQAPANQDPLVVTDYVYVDQTAVPVGVRGTRPASTRPNTSGPAALTGASTSKDQPATARTQPGDSASSGDATAAPASPTAGGSTPTQPAASPTTSAPSSTSTAPPAPSATSKPAATSTAVPAAATSTPGASQPADIEFVGSVMAINGDMVTFSHGGTSTIVKVTSNLAALHNGTQAHVHAVLSGGIYVATEIEVGG